MKANLGTKKGINVHNSAESTCNRLPKLNKLQLKFNGKRQHPVWSVCLRAENALNIRKTHKHKYIGMGG